MSSVEYHQSDRPKTYPLRRIAAGDGGYTVKNFRTYTEFLCFFFRYLTEAVP